MKIYTVVRKGEFHPVYCEDFLLVKNLGDNHLFCAVMDGCSSGKDSHFASALIGKLLNKIIQTLPYQPIFEHIQDSEPQVFAKEILKMLFMEMIKARNDLFLDRNEMLSTLLMMVYDFEKKQAFIIVIGDGFVCIDHTLHEIDQNNRPDYLAYHLGEEFETWYEKQSNIFLVNHPTEISISSDGIDTFKTNQAELPENFNPIDYLLKDKTFEKLPNMLHRKCQILKTQYGYLPGDDVSIVRVIF